MFSGLAISNLEATPFLRTIFTRNPSVTDPSLLTSTSRMSLSSKSSTARRKFGFMVLWTMIFSLFLPFLPATSTLLFSMEIRLPAILLFEEFLPSCDIISDVKTLRPGCILVDGAEEHSFSRRHTFLRLQWVVTSPRSPASPKGDTEYYYRGEDRPLLHVFILFLYRNMMFLLLRMPSARDVP